MRATVPYETSRKQAGARIRGERVRWVCCSVGSGAPGQKDCGIVQWQWALYRAVEVKRRQIRSAPEFGQMQSPAGSQCCRATSRDHDDIKGPQALQWHRIITDIGLTTIRCQQSWVG
ncbi:hypothetical protein NDU88_006106 [Pleurodeles waltl]|uniref:Uncharacterized protein n=1 Tax=Pleurodeles waltl TaxID=8319 RepID=A0AAV7WFA0_PLEWA|nr:hypothetical protein NDU88_006106 [Pleurodeles waltl]